MTLPEKEIRWKPTLPQSKILQSNKKFKVFLGGVGCGKTSIGWMNIIKEGLEQPGILGLIVAVNYSMIRDVIWQEMPRWIPEELILKIDQTHKELEFTNGSKILFRSADNPRQIERLRGMSLGMVWLDEITLMPEMVWKILVGRLRQPGMKYSVLLTGTPKMNWVYDTFIDPQKKIQSDEFFILKEIPSFSNIYLPPEYLKSLTEQYTGQFFEQEVLGRFISFEGLIYDLKPEWIIEPPKHKSTRIMYGVDFGFKNPSAIVVIGEYQNRYYILDEFYQRKVTDDELIDVLKSKQAYWGIGRVYCDPSAPASIEKMKREGVQAEKANNDVLGGIRQVRTLMDSGRLFVSSTCQNCINEFRSYVWDDTQKKEMPVKLHDHLQDSIRYVLIELSKPIIKPIMMPDFGSSVGMTGY